MFTSASARKIHKSAFSRLLLGISQRSKSHAMQSCLHCWKSDICGLCRLRPQRHHFQAGLTPSEIVIDRLAHAALGSAPCAFSRRFSVGWPIVSQCRQTRKKFVCSQRSAPRLTDGRQPTPRRPARVLLLARPRGRRPRRLTPRPGRRRWWRRAIRPCWKSGRSARRGRPCSGR